MDEKTLHLLLCYCPLIIIIIKKFHLSGFNIVVYFIEPDRDVLSEVTGNNTVQYYVKESSTCIVCVLAAGL